MEGRDRTVERWFLSGAERRNRASEIRSWTEGNRVTALVHGSEYFPLLYRKLSATEAGDCVYFADFRGDTEEQLDGEGTEIGEVLAELAARKVLLFGLIWRSQPGWLDQSEGKNAELARRISEEGGQVLLDPRTRRGGAHHQKFVVIRRFAHPDEDVAFLGGIDLGPSRNDGPEPAHLGDPQVIGLSPRYTASRPPWHRRPVLDRRPGGRRRRAHLPGEVVRQQRPGPVQPHPLLGRPGVHGGADGRPGSARTVGGSAGGR